MRTLQFNKNHNIVSSLRTPVVGERMNAMVINDGLKRFQLGDPIITSPVVSVSGKEELGYLTAKTMNTTYVVIPDEFYGKGQLLIEVLDKTDLEKKREDLVLGN